MSRSTAFLGTLAAVSLIANAWQYLHRGAADAPPTGASAVPHDAATAPRRTPEECARLAHEQRVARLRDPVQREAIRRLQRSNARQLMAAVGRERGPDRPRGRHIVSLYE